MFGGTVFSRRWTRVVAQRRTKDACVLADRIGHTFKAPELLTLALTHSSVRPGSMPNEDNERLEFLGDRVLGLAIAQLLSPVLSERKSIAFVMPKKYSLNNLPKPIDERIKIIAIPSRIIAALRFSGRWSSSLETEKFSVKGSVFSMRYSSPFTPWFLRRNEVAVEVSLK